MIINNIYIYIIITIKIQLLITSTFTFHVLTLPQPHLFHELLQSHTQLVPLCALSYYLNMMSHINFLIDLTYCESYNQLKDKTHYRYAEINF